MLRGCPSTRNRHSKNAEIRELRNSPVATSAMARLGMDLRDFFDGESMGFHMFQWSETARGLLKDASVNVGVFANLATKSQETDKQTNRY